jgi:hypothetical protein
MTQPDELAGIAPGSILLHVGLPKTGTTALQTTLAHRRPKLAEHGVVYPGTQRNHRHAIYDRGGLGTRFGEDLVAPAGSGSRRPWHELLNEVSSAGDARVVISHESMSKLDLDARRGLIRDFDRAPHVVITLRNLAATLPSSYQQRVKIGRTPSFDTWLHWVLDVDPWEPGATEGGKGFDFGRAVRSWVDVVGAENVTVVALDPANRGLVPRTFEHLLGVPDGMLEPKEMTGRGLNRGLTVPEVALVRALNRELHKIEQFTWNHYEQLVIGGPVHQLLTERTPPADEPALAPPEWAVDRAVTIAERACSDIGTSGVRVVGDLDTLTARVPANDLGVTPVTDIPLDIARIALMGSILPSAGLVPARDASRSLTTRRPTLGAVEFVPSRVLADQLRRKVVARAKRRLKRS